MPFPCFLNFDLLLGCSFHPTYVFSGSFFLPLWNRVFMPFSNFHLFLLGHTMLEMSQERHKYECDRGGVQNWGKKSSIPDFKVGEWALGTFSPSCEIWFWQLSLSILNNLVTVFILFMPLLSHFLQFPCFFQTVFGHTLLEMSKRQRTIKTATEWFTINKLNPDFKDGKK